MKSPKIFLAVDNCFASKRWTGPSEWMRIIKESGAFYVEASADTECDPLYTCRSYMEDWIEAVKEQSAQTGVKVANLYSGHGTYATLGLAHTDVRIRDHMLRNWLKVMLEVSVRLGAGMGFFCHAFPDAVLQSPEAYRKAEEDLCARLSELAASRRDGNKGYLCMEQMYTPHQIPWTIKGAQKLLEKVYGYSGSPFYITIDTGHQSAQKKFLRPDYGMLKELAVRYKNGERRENTWLGPKTAYDLLYRASKAPETEGDASIRNVEAEMDKYPYLFSNDEDGDTYLWLEKLGCFSPIIHLQQTTGTSSAHRPFTPDYNKTGIIAGAQVLKALHRAYQQEEEGTMPPKCGEIYLTLEIFSGTADINEDILYNLRESIKYWRRYVPEDGMHLDELIKGI